MTGQTYNLQSSPPPRIMHCSVCGRLHPCFVRVGTNVQDIHIGHRVGVAFRLKLKPDCAG
ncbi:hypothetical protein BJX99DRAFT_259037 [Aspergillus californicus]